MGVAISAVFVTLPLCVNMIKGSLTMIAWLTVKQPFTCLASSAFPTKT